MPVEAVGDPSEILDAVAGGNSRLGIIEEPSELRDGVTLIAPIYASVLHVLHHADMQAENFGELIRGNKVYAGPGAGAARRLLVQLAADFGVAPEQYTLLDNPWLQTPDVFFVTGGLLPNESLQRMVDYRLFSFGDPAALGHGTVAEALALKHSHVRTFVLPEGLYGELTRDAVLTIAMRASLIGPADMDARHAYRIAETLYGRAQELSVAYPFISDELRRKLETEALTLPMHRGARRFLDRDKPGFIERYVEIIGLGLTLGEAAFSATAAAIRRQRQQRKDRVDVYYRRIIELRETITPELDAAGARRLAEDVRAVQHEVFGLLVEERIDANDTLTLFLDLSNQVLKEIDALHAPA